MDFILNDLNNISLRGNVENSQLNHTNVLL